MRGGSLAVTLLVVASAGASAESVAAQEGSSAQDTAAIQRVLARRITALNSGNMSDWLSLWSDDVRLIDPAGNDVVGMEALRSWVQPYFAELRMEYAEAVQELVVSDGWGFAHVTYTFRVTPKTGGATNVERGKGILIFRRDGTGSWRISRLLFAPSPAQPPPK